MGVLNKLKSRMRYSGPTQVDPTKSSPVYGFDTGRAVRSGVDAVNMGLAAGNSAAPIVSNVGEQIAEAGANIGSALGAMGNSKRSESISKSKEAGKTGMEARSQWKKEKSEDLAARGKKAADEGKDKKADRLLKRAAKNEDRSIDLEEKAYFKKHGKRKPVEVTSLEPEGYDYTKRDEIIKNENGTHRRSTDENNVVTEFVEVGGSGFTDGMSKKEKFGGRFANAPIIDENLI